MRFDTPNPDTDSPTDWLCLAMGRATGPAGHAMSRSCLCVTDEMLFEAIMGDRLPTRDTNFQSI